MAEAGKLIGLGSPRLARMLLDRVVSIATRPLSGAPEPDATEAERRLRGAPVRNQLNNALTGRRSTAYQLVELSRMKRIAEAHGVTVNDIHLAACTTAMRAWLGGQDASPDGPLQALMPVNTRDERDGSNNNYTFSIVRLPAFVDDPLERLELIHAATEGFKSHRPRRKHSRLPVVGLADVVQIVHPVAIQLLFRAYVSGDLTRYHTPFAHATISNVPGPRESLWIGGARLEQIYPFGPVLAGANLNFTAVSYRDAFGVGVVTCPDNVPDVWQIAEAWMAGIDELERLAD